MEDMAPKLIEDVTGEFHRLYDASGKISGLLAKVKAKTATYAEAQEYALEVSRLIGQAWQKYVKADTLPDGKMYYNIASRLIPAVLDENHALVAGYAVEVQKGLNDRAGIGLKAQKAELDGDRVDGLVELASNAERYDQVSGKLLSAFENFSQHTVDETIRKNADLHYNTGLTPKIIRRSNGKCCAWCRSLAGSHDYPAFDRDVYRRHDNCRCTVLYDPADGKRKRQDVHTKRWTDSTEYDKIEKRKQTASASLLHNLSNHPKRLASFSPEKLLYELEREGFELKPLMQGSLKGITFEQGGGFKVNFEDGGLFQYHPVTKSHHGGAYYKFSTGKGGTHRYDLDGNEIKD